MTDDSRYLVLGTAGHIDHGKTSLIRTITGIDCDTMQEEKDRGITINLGFAHFQLPGGTRLGIVDVPGHRRFIRNMVAGAQGVDLVMLVIAADDAVMPQTKEHLHILRLLGVRAGLVALNKIDLVDEELRELAVADVEDLIDGTFLEGKPIVPVSATTGEGIEELTKALDEITSDIPSRNLGDRFRMPIDRVFTIKGAGTVVTGTTLAGKVKEGDEIAILPGDKRARVRTIQVHGERAATAGPGKRVAVNLVGIEKDELHRGQSIAEPDSLESTYMFDADIELIPGEYSPLSPGSVVHLHIGTAEVTARVYPLDKPFVGPGESAVAQLRLDEMVAISANDRFILRNSTQEDTIGGGMVLDAHPLKHRKKREAVAGKVSELIDSGLDAAIRHEISKTRYGIGYHTLVRNLNISPETFEKAVDQLLESGGGAKMYGEGKKRYFTLGENRTRIATAVEKTLNEHHNAHPLSEKGLTLKAIAKGVGSSTGAPVVSDAVVESVADLVGRGKVEETNETYILAGSENALNEKDRLTIEIILEHIGNSSQPRQLAAFKRDWPVDRKRLRSIVEYMLETKQIVNAPGGIMFSMKAVEWIREKLVTYLRSHGEVSVSSFRAHIDSSRKYTIPILQYFEDEDLITRDGDIRHMKG